jgi:hypothetical protein
MRQAHALGGFGRLDSKWLAVNERISKIGSTAITTSLADRFGGPGFPWVSSVLPIIANHNPASSK